MDPKPYSLLDFVVRFLLTIGTVVSCRPAQRQDSAPFVYGGKPVEAGQASFVVALVEVTGGEENSPIKAVELVCSGVLIRPQVVLTAGHCLFPESNPLAPPVSLDDTWLPMEALESPKPPSGPSAPETSDVPVPKKTLWVLQGDDVSVLQDFISHTSSSLQSLQTSSPPSVALAAAEGFKIFPTLWVDPLSHGDLGLLLLRSPLWLESRGDFQDAHSSAAHFRAPWDELVLHGHEPLPDDQAGNQAQILGFGRREDGNYGQKYAAPLSYQRRLLAGETSGYNVVLGGLFQEPEAPPVGPGDEEEPGNPESPRITDSCDGDSGGPLMLVPRPKEDLSDPKVRFSPAPRSSGLPLSHDSRPYLWGLASYGVSLECGRGTAFQSIFQGRCWIRHAIDQVYGSRDPHPSEQNSPQVDPWTGQCRLDLEPLGDTSPPQTDEERLEALTRLCLSQSPSSAYDTFRELLKTLPQSPTLQNPEGSSVMLQPPQPEEQCARWAEQLSRLQVVDLEGRSLFDPRPLALLSAATVLRLGRNQFENVSFLGQIPRLTTIDITGNLALDADHLRAIWSTIPRDPAAEPLVVIGQSRQYQNRSPLMTRHPQDPGRPFLEACKSTEPLPKVRKTFDALMGRTQSQSCDQLWRRLLMLDKLLLRQRGITDLSPLSHFSHLISLDLSGNPDLTDVSPLVGLESLKTLKLKGTGVRDLSPLSPLIKRHGLVIEL